MNTALNLASLLLVSKNALAFINSNGITKLRSSSSTEAAYPFGVFAKSDTNTNNRSCSYTTTENETETEFYSSRGIVFDILEVNHMKNSFCVAKFSETNCWGRSPLLMRGTFHSQAELLKLRSITGTDENDDDNDNINDDDDSDRIYSLWPTWDEVMDLAFEDDAESRLITHVPGDPLSWKLRLGPFDAASDDLHLVLQSKSQLNTNDNEDKDKDQGMDEKWTMVFNDVDRFYPPLFDFITDSFSFIPQWRKDDGQISLSNAGGGIGPHTDDYDVFLIQMAGERRWDIGKRIISTREELDNLHDGLDVRILNFWEDEVKTKINNKEDNNEGSYLVESFILKPGDVLYLPPRFAHCGTALSDGCMTLSVGLRAPSAKEMLTKVTECVEGMVDGDFVKRYTDEDLFHRNGTGSDSSSDGSSISNGSERINEITSDVKMRSRQLLKDAFLNLIEDDLFFDELFGTIVTESKRVRTNYPTPLRDLDDSDIESLGVFGNPALAVEMMLSGSSGGSNSDDNTEGGEVCLYTAEGIAWSYSIIDKEVDFDDNNNKNDSHSCICRLFVDGRKWEIAIQKKHIITSSSSSSNGNGDSNNDENDSDDGNEDKYRNRVIELMGILCSENVLRGELFEKYHPLPEEFTQLLQDLVEEGYLYGSSE